MPNSNANIKRKQTPIETSTAERKPVQKLLDKLYKLGLDRALVASKMFVDVQSIRRWEAGTHEPMPGTLRRLEALVESETAARKQVK